MDGYVAKEPAVENNYPSLELVAKASPLKLFRYFSFAL